MGAEEAGGLIHAPTLPTSTAGQVLIEWRGGGCIGEHRQRTSPRPMKEPEPCIIQPPIINTRRISMFWHR